MEGFELLLMLGCGWASYVFLKRWYDPLLSGEPVRKNAPARALLLLLPVVCLAIILFTLTRLAAFDVVDAPIYILLYVAMGFAWLLLGLIAMAALLDLSWPDDALHRGHQAALAPMVGGVLGLTLIYCGANIGDGPGWWCVVFAGGLGLCAWVLLGIALNAATGVCERVTLERDVGAGIRLGCYLVASGLLLGRASGGDWTSFSATVVEFGVGWPVLPLTLLAMLAEWAFGMRRAEDARAPGSSAFGSATLGLIYLALAFWSLTILPPI